MNTKDFESELIRYTTLNSHFDNTRNYISLSNVSKPVEDILYDYYHGYNADTKAMLKCYKGYQMERDLKQRIQNVCTIMQIPFSDKIELSLGADYIKGHPDLLINNIPAYCKSVLKDEWLPETSRNISYKIKCQLNAYMMAANCDYAYAIYESRESGLLKELLYDADRLIQKQITDKIEQIIKAVNK